MISCGEQENNIWTIFIRLGREFKEFWEKLREYCTKFREFHVIIFMTRTMIYDLLSAASTILYYATKCCSSTWCVFSISFHLFPFAFSAISLCDFHSLRVIFFYIFTLFFASYAGLNYNRVNQLQNDLFIQETNFLLIKLDDQWSLVW